MKKKGIINYGTKRSDRGPGGSWIVQGPFGKGWGSGSGNGLGAGSSVVVSATGPVGFSINGGTRSPGYVGKSMAFSKNGTPFLGQFARGTGGIGGRYPNPQSVFNSPPVRGITQGQQAEYIKPSVLTTKGMLEKKYKWIHNGQYPNVWVQPVYPNGSMSDNASQLLYIQQKAAANICVNDTNKEELYVGHRRCSSAGGCDINANALLGAASGTSGGGGGSGSYRPFKIIDSAGLYTKFIKIPQTSSQYTLQVQRLCANPVGRLKPFPFATNGGTGNASSNFVPPPIAQIYYDTPPEWYWA